MSKEIIFLVFAVKQARGKSTPGGVEWHDKWRELDDNDRWKQFGDYWKRQDVETTRDRTSIAFAYDERGVENPDYRLPLATFTKNEIIVRKCYRTLYDHVLKRRNAMDHGLVLTGQPGTGASSSWLPVMSP